MPNLGHELFGSFRLNCHDHVVARETKVLKYYYYETVGTRTIFGTRWPIVAFASADQHQYRSGLLCKGFTERVNSTGLCGRQ